MMTAEDYLNKGIEEYKKGNYKEAIPYYKRVIELNPMNTLSYNNLGIIYGQQQNYQAAVDSFTKAIEIVPNNSKGYVNRGMAYQYQEKYKEAIKDYTEAIKIEPKEDSAYNNRALIYMHQEYYENAIIDFDHAIRINPKEGLFWYLKGLLHRRAKDDDHQNEELAQIYFIRAIYLDFNLADIFSEFLYQFTLPFLSFRLIQTEVKSTQYHQIAALINKTFQQCNGLYSFIAYQNIQKQKRYSSSDWQKWLGIINYYMGDPITSFKLLKELIDSGSQDLMIYYYLILSCYEFAEDEGPYAADAIFIAERIKAQSIENISDYEQIMTYYYAGLLFELDTEDDDALECFSKIQKNFLPAAYKMLSIYHKNGQEEELENVKNIIVKRENKKSEYAQGRDVHCLNFENDTLSKPFANYVHFFEIEESVYLLDNLAEDEVNFEIQWAYNQPRFYELFKVRPEDLEEIRLKTDIAPNFELWEEQLKLIKAASNIEELKFQDIDAKNIFKLLQNASSKSELEIDFSLNIQKFNLKIEDYKKMLVYFYLKGHLSEYQKLLLHFYIYYRNAQEQSSAHISGLSKIVQVVVGVSLVSLTNIVTGNTVATGMVAGLTTAYAQGALGQLFSEWHIQKKSSFKTYQAFKDDFEIFIATERERLGANKFQELYPIDELK